MEIMEKGSQNPSFGQGLELAGIITKAIASAAKKTNAGSNKVQAIIERPGIIFQLAENLFTEDGNTKENSSILRLISGTEKLAIEALDGKACISDAKKVFFRIDKDFKEWGLDQSGSATGETLVDVSEIVKDATFVQIFTGISSNLEKIVMTQAQIIYFCKKHLDWLRQEKYATFFLTKVAGECSDEYFVVFVHVVPEGQLIYVGRLGNNKIWAANNLRVVYPRLVV